jgi:alkylhydroperoxidase family enzyme
MRNAGLVDCKLCRAVRYVPAIDDGLTEERLALVNDSWDQATLSECEKAALYLADACLVDPAIMSQGVRNRVLACFTEQQIAEIVLLLVLVRFNKVTLAFGGNADVSGVLLVTQSSVKERADDL